MGRLLVLLGIVLIFASIVFMGLTLGMAGEDVSAQIISPFAVKIMKHSYYIAELSQTSMVQVK